MKRTMMIAIAAGAGAPLILAGPADAGFRGLLFEEKPNPFALLTFNLYAWFDERPDDFVFAVAGTPLSPLNINVRQGTFYQNLFGNDLAPNPTLFPIYPSLEFDTFVTIGAKTSVGDATSLAPGWPGFGPDQLAFDDTGWFITPDDPQGNPDANNRVLLGQFSTADGQGFYGSVLVSGFDNGVDFLAYLTFDTQPAPAGLALFGVATLIGVRRSRRE